MVSTSLQTRASVTGIILEEKDLKHKKLPQSLYQLQSVKCFDRNFDSASIHDRALAKDANEVLRTESQQQSYERDSTEVLLHEFQSNERDCGRIDEAKALVASLKLCTKHKDVERGTKLHHYILERGLLDDCSTALATMYAKCGQLGKAKALLDMYKIRNLITWTAIISGYVRQGQSQDALACFECMQQQGISPDAVTFAGVLKACGAVKALDQGKAIHNEIVRQGLLENDTVLGNMLLDMYVKCDALEKARSVLEELPVHDVVSSNTLIVGYVQHGNSEEALRCYKFMRHEGIIPDEVTYACILKSCGRSRDIVKGMQIHDELSQKGLLEQSILLSNALVDMYAKCGALKKAQRVLMEFPFRDVVTWNTLIAGYAQNGQGESALKCFDLMLIEGMLADAVTYVCILNACGIVRASNKGKQVHLEIVRRGLSLSNSALGNALVDMYAKCGALEEAQHVLCKLQSRDVVSWSTLIAGYIEQAKGELALDCYECMQNEGILPDAMTFASLSKACGLLGALDTGNQIYDKIASQELLGSDIVLGNALVDMYAKISCLVKARFVLEKLPARDVFSWNALIAGHVQQGQGGEALECLKCMQQDGISPNEVTFSCILNVCSHLGLVEESDRIFEEMSTKHGLNPTLEGFICIIDLFGRVGLLGKAVKVIQGMPSSDHSEIWHTLLVACRTWADVQVGRWAFEHAMKLNKEDGAAYILMADTYAAAYLQGSVKGLAECAEKCG